VSDTPSKEHIEFAEKKADEQMKHHLEDMAILNREAHVTFAFTATVLSAAFGYFLKLYDPGTAFTGQKWRWLAPVIALNLHLAITGAYCLHSTLRAKRIEHPGNLPQNLLEDDLDGKDILEVRHRELYGLADRIEKNRLLNLATGKALNRTRSALLFAPITFLVVWGLAEVVRAAVY
jgi:hypothetical protein